MSDATIPGEPNVNTFQTLYWNAGTSQWQTTPIANTNQAYYGSALGISTTMGSENDFANGRGGADTIIGGNGNDILVGGDGADRLEGGFGADTLIGGNATVTGSLTTGTFTITPTNDGLNADTLIGGDGNDSFIVTNQSDSLSGGAGTDSVLLSGPISYTLGASTSVEIIRPLDVNSTTNYSIAASGTGAQEIIGALGNDTLTGNGGNDTLVGGGGNDSLSGGDDADVMLGGTGNNTLDGGTGTDLFNLASSSNNSVIGGDGEDTITFTNAGTYTVTGASGSFTITGAGGVTTVSGVEKLGLNTGDVDLIAGEFFVCFAAGTRILTARGEVEVERLQAGDLVATLAGRGAPMKPVLWVGRRRVVLAGHPNADDLAPIRIRTGALGEGAPHRDLLVSPDHCMFLDGKLVPARLLVNGTSITVERGVAEVTWFHVELESHDVLLAEGAAAESWLDCDNRSWFENAPVAQLAVHGSLTASGTGWDASRACAPLVHSGAELAAIREAIAARAGEIAEPARRSAAA